MSRAAASAAQMRARLRAPATSGAPAPRRSGIAPARLLFHRVFVHHLLFLHHLVLFHGRGTATCRNRHAVRKRHRQKLGHVISPVEVVLQCRRPVGGRIPYTPLAGIVNLMPDKAVYAARRHPFKTVPSFASRWLPVEGKTGHWLVRVE